MNQKMFRYVLLSGVMVWALGLGACTTLKNNEVLMGDAPAERPVVMIDGKLVDPMPEVCVPSEDEDCEEADTYLTNRFVQDEEDVIALSRPAGLGTVSVKDKQNKMAQSTPDKVLYTAQPARGAGVKTAAGEALVPLAAVVVDATNSTVTVDEDMPNTTVVVSEPTAPSVVIDETATTVTTETTSAPTQMVPLKKVTTTITETTTKIQRDPKMAAEFSKMSLAERIQYGESVQDWEATAGQTLRGLLMDWGNRSGWTVVWKLDRDYHLEAGVVFRGTFTEVASALVRSFARATPAPIGTFYQGNRVLVVSTQEDENER